VKPFEKLPSLTFAHGPARLHEGAYWYRRFRYETERQRGFDFEEDLFSPFSLDVELGMDRPVSFVVSTVGRPVSDAEALLEQEVARREKITGPRTEKSALRAFRRAADQFLVARGDGTTVIAGYPWFTDWGRDTMIALPGLTLATDRPEIAKRILSTFAKFVDRGMLPNRFLDAGKKDESEYNTIDATLWFVEAVRAYHEKTNDEAFLKELYPTLLAIVDAHVAGTRYGIHVDEDGLLSSGAEGVQLTWMDAKVGDWVVTPRRGKPVEIQALWFNAVSFLEKLAERLGDSSTEARLKSLVERAQASFDRLFWNETAGCLYDNIDEHGVPDPSIRPNQIFAVSLPFPLLTGERAAKVVATVERDLLTPFGLRTLAASDPAYKGRYEGGPAERDGAYHQGTVWPWLIGPFVIAYLKTRGHSTSARLRAVDFLRPLVRHMRGSGLGQLPEIVDGDVPRRPAGCFAQAWSVAQVYEAALVAGLPNDDSAGFRALG
jgi:predicted glycogen debranching enzyme